MNYETAKIICQKFAVDHSLIFEEEGECGFGRECVGFIAKNGNWLDYNPYNRSSYEQIVELQCEDVEPPANVNNYHKHDCMAVLGRGEEAVVQLAEWVEKINRTGNAKVVKYETNAVGILAICSGVEGYAIIAGNTALNYK